MSEQDKIRAALQKTVDLLEPFQEGGWLGSEALNLHKEALELLEASRTPAPQEDDLRKFRYAPGGYNCVCYHCKERFSGDKRARCCKTCAENMLKAENLPQDNAEALEALEALDNLQHFVHDKIMLDDEEWEPFEKFLKTIRNTLQAAYITNTQETLHENTVCNEKSESVTQSPEKPE